jgi:hypothetical protein
MISINIICNSYTYFAKIFKCVEMYETRTINVKANSGDDDDNKEEKEGYSYTVLILRGCFVYLSPARMTK